MKQTREVRFKCDPEQHEQIKRKARMSGMTIKNYLLYLALHTEIEIKLVE